MNNEKKVCQNCKSDFIIENNDLLFSEKMKVPVPSVCPDCRFKMRAMWRNETTLYTGQKCGLCDKNIISRYNPSRGYTVYCWRCFYSENWDPKDFALDYDESKSFMDQLKIFLSKTPKINVHTSESTGAVINSEYGNSYGAAKNSYFIFNTDHIEDTLYARGCKYIKESSDLYFCHESDRCYQGINLIKSNGISFGQNISNCVDCLFVTNCSGLINCFGCFNLRNKSNCWFNEQLSHEEYIKRLNEVTGSYSKIEEQKEKFNEFVLKFPHRENNNLKTIGSIGDYLFNCKNVQDSFEVFNSEDSKYLFSCKDVKNSMDVLGWGVNSSNLLNTVSVGLSSNIIGSFGSENCQNVLYSSFLKNCQECLACDTITNSKYCIFNKQYLKEEYERLKSIAIRELEDKGLHGLMIDPELSFYSYNETLAQDFFPLTKEEAIEQGYRWEDNIQMTKGRETIQPEKIPDHIKDVSDFIASEILKCISCERNYKIIEQELLFYRKINLPIPRQCFYCRHQDRIKRRGPYKFWDRKCDHCGKDIKTNYSPDRKEIIYCEKCYQNEVV
jgi:hypothetical protein